jgi:rhodanese-related sulfurtransferase
VREPWEFETSSIAGARLIPLGTLPTALPTLDPAREIVVLCRVGGRSARAADIMREAGFERVRSLAGGLVAWEAAGAAP